MSTLIRPEHYHALLDKVRTEQAIKLIKDFFQQNLSTELRLRRVTAPLFVMQGLGINDDLNGIERPVTFPIKDLGDARAEVVHSLAKWKRLTLAEYKIKPGYGIYTDMNAIRRDEELDNIHSIYVDQWDWEKVIRADQRTEEYLEETVTTIYNAMKNLGDYVNRLYRDIQTELPNEITFITTQELEDRYPDNTPKERERFAAKEYGAVFIKKIGGVLASGQKHDGRAPDYDDWELNGDIIVWNDVLDDALELSSMGIRVDKEAMEYQCKIDGKEDRLKQSFHQSVLNGDVPLSIGGGIGQSRICMFFLQKAHIGEVQASVWPEDMIEACANDNVFLL